MLLNYALFIIDLYMSLVNQRNYQFVTCCKYIPAATLFFNLIKAHYTNSLYSYNTFMQTYNQISQICQKFCKAFEFMSYLETFLYF